ncbi:hypothetical protein WQ54_28760 [Bacillus sp. SA1-12]|uniref:hypothetical protein n=1 Tax=Bacillus sp. SA1-12 TaxID=1455638 RepID=UPI000626F04E|nr:hypothetical protein [Bacillus sp. SA1-12]KKI88915.1 hypothetical protein WQ54_28760 [Bacillus sp. SA1-12]
MYITIVILASVFMIISLIRNHSNRNWKQIYSTHGNEEYFKIVAKLKEEGITYKVETSFRGFNSRNERFKDDSQYNIFVKKDEEHKAVRVLHKTS